MRKREERLCKDFCALLSANPDFYGLRNTLCSCMQEYVDRKVAEGKVQIPSHSDPARQHALGNHQDFDQFSAREQPQTPALASQSEESVAGASFGEEEADPMIAQPVVVHPSSAILLVPAPTVSTHASVTEPELLDAFDPEYLELSPLSPGEWSALLGNFSSVEDRPE
eukprot:m.897709 g.897709  ORF g.897709 m.897709 type:complete len:168 (-) comp60019_c0_seq1:257-760(-)